MGWGGVGLGSAGGWMGGWVCGFVGSWVRGFLGSRVHGIVGLWITNCGRLCLSASSKRNPRVEGSQIYGFKVFGVVYDFVFMGFGIGSRT